MGQKRSRSVRRGGICADVVDKLSYSEISAIVEELLNFTAGTRPSGMPVAYCDAANEQYECSRNLQNYESPVPPPPRSAAVIPARSAREFATTSVSVSALKRRLRFIST